MIKPPEPDSNFFNTVFDILAAHTGAQESNRANFVVSHTSQHPCDEYRFIGTLGFGGKYYRKTNQVSCYSEDENGKRREILRKTNKALAKLTQPANNTTTTEKTINRSKCEECGTTGAASLQPPGRTSAWCPRCQKTTLHTISNTQV